MTAETLMFMGGLAAFVLTVYWVRSRELRENYAIGWVGVASLLLLCGLFPELIKSFATASHLSYPAAVLFIALAAIYVFAFAVSLTLSRQHRRNVRLMQELALLEQRLQAMEQQRPAAASGPGHNSGP